MQEISSRPPVRPDAPPRNRPKSPSTTPSSSPSTAARPNCRTRKYPGSHPAPTYPRHGPKNNRERAYRRHRVDNWDCDSDHLLPPPGVPGRVQDVQIWQIIGFQRHYKSQDKASKIVSATISSDPQEPFEPYKAASEGSFDVQLLLRALILRVDSEEVSSKAKI